MADNYGKQGVRTLDYGDVISGILDSGNTQINPAKEAGNLLDIKDRIGDVTTPAAGSTNELLTEVLAAVGGAGTDVALYSADSTAGNGGTSTYTSAALAADTKLLSVVCSASVYATFLIQVDPAGGTAWVTHWMAVTSESSPTVNVDCGGFSVPAGGKVHILKTNYNKAVTSYDLHSTVNAQQ
jgi:hypothetical protein